MDIWEALGIEPDDEIDERLQREFEAIEEAERQAWQDSFTAWIR